MNIKFYKILICLLFVISIIFNSLSIANVTWQNNNSNSKDRAMTKEVNISNSEYSIYGPEIAAYQNYIHVVYSDFINGTSPICYKRSSDGGLTWESWRKINDEDRSCGQPSIAVNGSNIHIVWSRDYNRSGTHEIMYKKSTDNGNTWSNQTVISFDDDITSWCPSIGVGDDLVVITWTDYKDSWNKGSFYYRISKNNGLDWEQSKKLTEHKQQNVFYSDIEIVDPIICVSWTDYRWSNNGDVFFKMSNNSGLNWSNEQKLAGEKYIRAVGPRLSIENNSIYLVYTEVIESKPETCFIKSEDLGKNWTESFIICNDSYNTSYAHIVVENGIVYLVFNDERNDNCEIFYKTSLDGGENWLPAVQITEYDNIISADSEFAKIDDTIHVIWLDGRDGTYQIYYKNFQINQPFLSRYELFPNIGDISTVFNFKVDYWEMDNVAPSFIYVQIDGINYSLIENDHYDTNYQNGKTYYYSTKLDIGTNHTYRFFASNGIYTSQTKKIFGPTVLPGPPSSIIVTPSNITITTDEIVQFNVTVFDEEKNILNETITWEISGGGIIDQTGLFDPTKPGTWTIYANTTSGISGKAIINVTLGKLTRINITPQNLNITTDDFVQFHATGYDLDDNIIDIYPFWRVTGGGIIDQTGNFSATKPGIWTVYANQSGVSGGTTIEITIGELARIDIIPKSSIITTDDYLQFYAEGYDNDNNSIPIEPFWGTNGGGTIDDIGNFTATTSGIWTVFAYYYSITSNTTIEVRLGKLDKIIIEPESGIITTDDNISISATGYDKDGNIIPIEPVWSYTGGTLDKNGIFTSKLPGIYKIFANYSGLSANITIRVDLGAISRIEVTPNYIEINATDVVHFSAKGFDHAGNLLDIKFEWQITGGGIIYGNGDFYGKASGNWIVFANHSGISGNATVFINSTGDSDKKDDKNIPDDGEKKDDDENVNYLLVTIGMIIFVILIIIIIVYQLFIRDRSQKPIEEFDEYEE